jgi:hypothetical protein
MNFPVQENGCIQENKKLSVVIPAQAGIHLERLSFP